MTLPTRNSQLALRRADFRSVPEMLDYAARGETGVTFYNARGEKLSSLAWREIRERAQRLARKLIGAGFTRDSCDLAESYLSTYRRRS